MLLFLKNIDNTSVSAYDNGPAALRKDLTLLLYELLAVTSITFAIFHYVAPCLDSSALLKDSGDFSDMVIVGNSIHFRNLLMQVYSMALVPVNYTLPPHMRTLEIQSNSPIFLSSNPYGREFFRGKVVGVHISKSCVSTNALSNRWS